MNKIKKALAALSLSLIQTTFNVGNQVKGIFVYNEKTSYCPYNQADHLVDGLLWHYDEKNKKAFFILARVVENNKFKFINNSQYLEDLKKNHFTEIDIDELRNNSDKNGGFDKYLYDSFVNARYTDPRISPKEQYPNVVESDFPLNNLAEYYNGAEGENSFWKRIFGKCLDEKGLIDTEEKSIEQVNCKIYVSWNGSEIFGDDSFLNEIPSDKLRSVINVINESILLSHGNRSTKNEEFNGHLSSLKSLELINVKSCGNADIGGDDERLKNYGFTFTMLCSELSKWNVGGYTDKSNVTNLFFKNFKKFPIIVSSKDQFTAHDSPKDYAHPARDDNNRCPGDVYICSGKDLSSVMARHYFSSIYAKNKNVEEGYNRWSIRWGPGSAKNWPCECRIPTYLILSDDDFYKPEE